MSRYTGPVCVKCRRLGVKLFLRGERCYTDKCSFERRSYPPGEHGQRRVKLSDYAVRLYEKQKLKHIYNLTDKQLRLTFNKAKSIKGNAGDNFIKILESRLDSVLYRSGLADTIRQARQFVSHRHVKVNGRIVNIPSYILSQGDEIVISEKLLNSETLKDILARFDRKTVASWLTVFPKEGKIILEKEPDVNIINLPVDRHLVVEYYSR